MTNISSINIVVAVRVACHSYRRAATRRPAAANPAAATLVAAAPVKEAGPVAIVVLLGPTGVAVAVPPPGAEEAPLPGAVPLADPPAPPVPTAPLGTTANPVPSGTIVVTLIDGTTMIGEIVVMLIGGITTVLVAVAVKFEEAVIKADTELVVVEIEEQPGIEKVPLMFPEPP